MSERRVYMDYNATTPLHPEVKKEMIEAMEIFGNASSFHSFGREARDRIEQVRENVASFIGAKPDEIIFTGSGSEANNTVLNIFTCSSQSCDFNKNPIRKRVVTSRIEHPCILETAKCIQARGVPVSYVRVDNYGKVDMNQLEEILATNEVGLVSIMMANNEIGTIQDIKTITALAHKYGALSHTDAVQAVGKIPVNVVDLDVDFLTISAHKIYGPKGVGVLFVKTGVPFCPFIRGGHQERGRRAGTENTLGIIGLGKAIDVLRNEMEGEIKRLWKLKNRLRSGIEKNIPDVKFNGHFEDSLPGTLNVSFDGAEGEAILLYLDLCGIAVSTGSACASGSLDPSHVLLAIGLEQERAHGSIRFSLGRENTEEDVDYVVEKLTEVIKKLRGMSTAYSRRK